MDDSRLTRGEGVRGCITPEAGGRGGGGLRDDGWMANVRVLNIKLNIRLAITLGKESEGNGKQLG